MTQNNNTVELKVSDKVWDFFMGFADETYDEAGYFIVEKQHLSDALKTTLMSESERLEIEEYPELLEYSRSIIKRG